MAGIKVFARRALMCAAFAGFLSVASVTAYGAAGYALSLGGSASQR